MIADNEVTLKTTPIEKFDRILARHLAAAIVMGRACDEDTVRRCYADTREELSIASHDASECYVDDLETYFVQNVVGLMLHHQPYLRDLPPDVLCTFISELLLDRSW